MPGVMVSERATVNEHYAEMFVFIVVFCLYARTIGFGLVFDDRALLAADGPLRLGGVLAYRPLRYWSYRLDAWLGGGAVWAYHLVNVVLHAAIAALVVRIGRKLGLTVALAAAAALLAATHPLAVEAVAYVSGRRDLLAAGCGLWALNLWIAPAARARAWAVFALLVASAAAKESGLVFVFVCAAASWSGVAPSGRRAAVMLAGAAAACTALIVAYGGSSAFTPASARSLLATAPHLLRHYLSGLSGLRGLSADYPEFARAAAGGSTGRVLELGASVLPLLSMLGVAWLLRRLHHRRAAFAAAWFMVVCTSIVLVGGFHEPGADRHAYPLLVPAALLLTFAASGLVDRGRRWAARPAQLCGAVLAVALVCVCARATFVRSAVWRDEASLWQAALSARPRSLRAHINLAAVYAERGRPGRARRYLEQALSLRRNYGPAHLGLAYLSCLHGRRQAAEAQLTLAAACGEKGERIARIRQLCSQATSRAGHAPHALGLPAAWRGE